MEKHSYFPSLETFREKAASATIVPVYREVLADTETPVSAFLKIDTGGDAFLLESVEGGEKWGRYSFLGVNPWMTLRSKNGRIETVTPEGTETTEGDPIEALKDLMAGFTTAPVEGLPRFYGGAIG